MAGVSNGLGTASEADVQDISVTCSDKALTLGGSIHGLGVSGLELVNGSVKLAVAANARRFTMPRTLSTCIAGCWPVRLTAAWWW